MMAHSLKLPQRWRGRIYFAHASEREAITSRRFLERPLTPASGHWAVKAMRGLIALQKDFVRNIISARAKR
jgi:hypothetical protein